VSLETLLTQSENAEIHQAVLSVLGEWKFDIPAALQITQAHQPQPENRPAWFECLARLGVLSKDAAIRSAIAETLEASLSRRISRPGCLGTLASHQENWSFPTTGITPEQHLQAMVDAGTDGDLWEGDYHGKIASNIQTHCQQYPHLITNLLAALRQALTEKDNWPARRIALAGLSACTEVMPSETQRAAGSAEELEALLVASSQDAGSFNARRFAISALGYLRKVTPAVVPVLVAGLQENVDIVREDTIKTVTRFQRVQGDILPELLPYLTFENAPTLNANIAKLLGALGVSPAADASSLRPRIIQALAEAVESPVSQQEVDGKKLANIFYEELLRVAGWL
jgi:hypothetical protein